MLQSFSLICGATINEVYIETETETASKNVNPVNILVYTMGSGHEQV